MKANFDGFVPVGEVNCTSCSKAGDCGQVGDPDALGAIGAQALNPKELIRLACTLARVSSAICDLGGVGTEQTPFGGPPGVDEPYIWDIKED